VPSTPLFLLIRGQAAGRGWSLVPNVAPILPINAKAEFADCPAGCPVLPQTSYWLGQSNEMAGIKNILIIVNVNGRKPLQLLAVYPSATSIRAKKWRKNGEIAAIN
jgi:hypothetical protein